MTHCTPVTNALKFLFRWLGQQSKRARWEDQRGGQVLKRERKIRRAVCSFTLIFFIALLDSQGKRGADDCVEGLGNVEMSRNKAAAGLPASSLCGVQGQAGWVSEAWHKVCKWFSLWTMHLAPNGFIQSFCGARTDLCWWFFFQSCFTPGVECERKILNRTGFCFVLWMLYTWSDQNLISDPSLPWANILVCILFR